jgi:hypothetical protein
MNKFLQMVCGSPTYNIGMRRLALFTALWMLALPGTAQMRGDGRGGAGARAAFGAHNGMSVSRGHFGRPGFTGITFGGHFGRGFNGHFRHHHRFFRNNWVWGYPIWAYYDPGFYDYSSDRSYYEASAAAESAAYDQQARLEQRMDRIEDRLDTLINRLQSTPASQTAPPPKPEPTSAATIVFRDGHTEEVENFAVVGQTLWIFTEQRARKVPMAQINTEATDQANQQRGIDLHLPKA